MSQPKKNKLNRRLHCEALEPRLLLTSNAPFSPVLDLQVDSGVIFNATTGAVSAWNDQAVGDNHLRSGGLQRPTFGALQTPTGLNAISFDGVDDRLLRDVNDAGGISGPPTNDKSRTMFLVAQFHDASILGGATYGRGALNQAFGLDVGGPGPDHGDIAVQGWAGNNDFYTNNNGFSTPGNSTGWMVLSVVHERDGFDPADNNWLYRDGTQIATWDHKFNTKLHSTLDLNGNTASRLVLGEGIKERGNVQMDVAAWLVYDEALSTSERNAVEGFLNATYLDSGSNQAPTANDDSTVIAEGGSTTIDILANDTDPDSLIDPTSVAIIGQPSHATNFFVNAASGVVTYVHDGSGQNDSFTYRVNDSVGATSNLATVSITISSDVLPVTAGLVTWFETDAGVSLGSGFQVEGWLDGSGTGIEIAASGNPQFVPNATPSGRPAIAFDGAGDKLEIVSKTALADLPNNAEDRTVFVVANYLDAQGVQVGFAYGKGNANRAFGVGADGATGRLAVQGFRSNNNLVSATPGISAGWQVQAVVLSNNNLRHFESSTLIDSWTHVYQTRIDAPSSRMVLGQVINGAGYSQFEVGAVLVYDRALSASDRLQVENYLSNKYTLGTSGNQPPTANNDSYSTTVGGVINTASNSLPGVLNNDTDPNFDPLNALLVSGPSHGSLTLQPNGAFLYTHNGSNTTADSFTYRANDGTANSNLATVNLTINTNTNTGDNNLIVRWHGDYYKHLWDSDFAGGSNPAVRENRWLRGGPVTGDQNSLQNLDLDNDGQFDDSRVFFDFSLTEPFNPPDTTSKPNGIIYHSELPSAKFYGGLSADFFNYETDRVQQAFIENDGAGGELDDVGYPSPYLTQQYQGLSDYVELVRHADGRPKKDHVGPHEDFAINLYRPDLPHPLNSQDNPNDNLVAFHAAMIWRKEDFLQGGASDRVSLDAESSFSFESTRWWDNVDEARWILQGATGQLYISQYTVSGVQDDWGFTNEFVNPLSSNWAVYNPMTNNLDFKHGAANWLNPVTNNLFHDIQAVGVYIANDTPSGDLTKFSLDEIRFNAVVNNQSSLAATSTGATILSLESPNLTLASPRLYNAPPRGTLVVEPSRTPENQTPLDNASSLQTSLEISEIGAPKESSSGEELLTELQSLDDAFALWI